MQPFAKALVFTSVDYLYSVKELELHRSLIEDCQKGNRKAQYRLYRMYSKAMYNICLRMVKNEFDAEDILQNAFVAVFKNIEKFNFKATPGAWIKRIVINNCIDFLRKKKIYFEEIDNVGVAAEPEELDESQIEYTIEKVKKALEKMSEGYATIFSLYAFEGYDHKEIGEILGVSEATSKSQYSRAKHKIRGILSEDKSIRKRL